jgi:two-component system, cell cycle response regulator
MFCTFFACLLILKKSRLMEIELIEYTAERVLIADDEKQFCGILQDLLNKRGIKSDFVNSGESALRELNEKKDYTFLLADIIMPGMNGIELTKRTASEFPEVAVIVMTGFTDNFQYIDVINAGAKDFINKPFRVDELEAKIRRSIIERNIRAELKRLTITDSLTGLYNQRHFYTRLNDEIMRAQRQDQKLALILLDLDAFKQYNDKHGHIAGDELLQKFGRIMNTQIRQGVDSVFRYGGDEFAIILVNADERTCEEIEKRISNVFKSEFNQSAAMGHAIYMKGMTPESFVIEADKGLYILKGKRKR